MSTGTFQITSARERKAKKTFTTRISDTLVVRMRKLEPLRLVMGGYMTSTMLASAQRFEELAERVSKSAAENDGKPTQADVFSMLDSEDKKNYLELLERYAAECVIEPKIVLGDAGDDEISVKDLDYEELQNIFYASAQEAGLPGSAELEEFRRSEQGTAGDAGPAGETVRAEPVNVAVPARTGQSA